MEAQNPLTVMLQSLGKSGLPVEIKQQSKNGYLETASDQQLATLGTKARIVSTAQILSQLNKSEKLQWALDNKQKGNELFREQKYSEAIVKYMDTLSASDFGTINSATDNDQSNDNNIDSIVVPVLNNLAACSIQMKEWNKVKLFCEQVLELRKNCSKAHLRLGLSSIKLGENRKAIEHLREAKNLSASLEGGMNEVELSNDMRYLTKKDTVRVDQLIEEAKLGMKRQQRTNKLHKQAIQKAFTEPKHSTHSKANSEAKNHQKTTKYIGNIYTFFTKIMIQFINIIMNLFRKDKIN